ncbi:signal transduction histidine kinase [Larkinella arboricola]|uniref:histidine kinase n=1 Tax=Larkinella arboricola TaxID=643671 RepID=A0A327WXW9_LARAB|nr:HAMP domain-containing histidine kinase [Larkinella arboricola]RAJ94375.1 signal transduction histidine kinase [Larkinella arboricola]
MNEKGAFSLSVVFLLSVSNPAVCQVTIPILSSTAEFGFLGTAIALALLGLLAYRLYQLQARQKVLISQKKELETQVAQLQHDAQRQNAFFSDIRHDLRSPVANLTNELVLLKSKAGHLPELARFERSVQELNLRLDNIIYWSLIQQNELPLFPRLVNLADLMREVIEEFDGLISQKSLVIKFDEQVATRLIDEILITLILRNSLYYAISVALANGVILISLRHEPVRTELIITNIGQGVTSDEPLLPQGKQSSSPGLLLSAELMKRSQGQLQIKNEFSRQPSITLSWP